MIGNMGTFHWLDIMRQDLRFAARTLAKSPGFTLIAALTLALGIGSSTAIFSVVNAVILRPLPYGDPERLVVLWGNVKRVQVERRGTSYADYFDWRDQSQSFAGMSMVTETNLTLTGVNEPERVPAEFVAQSYFSILGVAAALGRVFHPEEDQAPGRDAVVVLSDGLWKRRFGGDAGIIGRDIALDGRNYKVVGVMPPWFRGVMDSADLWIPLMMSGTAKDFANRGSRGPVVVALLKPGVSVRQAQSEMNGICKRLEAVYPATNEARGVEVVLLNQELFGDLRTPLAVLLAAVGIVLLIGCTNVANLLLARSEARQREIAVRIALGAGRARVLHQLTTESFVLVAMGAAAGLALAHWGVQALMAASPVQFPSYIRPDLDPRVALFTVAISCLAGLALGLAPALHVRAGSLNDAVKQAGGRTLDSRKGSRFRDVLVAAEVGFAMLLLVGAGLLIRSLRELSAIRPGYDPGHVLALRVSLPRPAPPSAEAATAIAATADSRAGIYARDIVNAAAQVPSVESAALGTDSPLTGASAIFYAAEGQPPVNATNRPRAYVHGVSPNFFQALRIRFIAGRTFTDQEMQTSPGTAVIVSENLVKRFWPGQDPIGKRIKAGGGDSKSPWMTIVGVVNQMKYRGVPNNPTADPDVFFPLNERQRVFTLLVRTPLDPESIAPSVRTALRAASPDIVIYNVTTMQQAVAQQTSRQSFTGWLMGIFAVAALLLSMIGIYGVISYSVSRRTQEIGIRMALGAARGEVVGMVLRRGMALIVAGLTLGIAAALGLTRLIATLLYGVSSTDTLSFAAAAATLGAVALIACMVPAMRASRIDPAIALRNE
jgi:putative ABC transport system permease protein